MKIDTFLLLLSGIAWSIVYIDAIRIGLRDKTYAMPLWALALNIAWEFLNAILGYKAVGITLQITINSIWFFLDLGLLYTFFRFGHKYFPKHQPGHWFYAWGVFALVTSFIIQFMFLKEFGLLMGAVYSAFLQNLSMSVLFINMLSQRSTSDGQSLLIAISKCIGTLAPTIYMGILGIKGVMAPNKLVLAVGILIFFFDVLYILLLAQTRYKEYLLLKTSK
jgi:hypothetical protein